MTCKMIVYAALATLLLCGGCGLSESVVQKEAGSFLWFTGDTNSATVYIDDLDPMRLANQVNASGKEDGTSTNRLIHYQISPGRHTIVITKSGEEVVNRTVLLGDGMTKEIEIP